jgi:hypothetical protein
MYTNNWGQITSVPVTFWLCLCWKLCRIWGRALLWAKRREVNACTSIEAVHQPLWQSVRTLIRSMSKFTYNLKPNSPLNKTTLVIQYAARRPKVTRRCRGEASRQFLARIFAPNILRLVNYWAGGAKPEAYHYDCLIICGQVVRDQNLYYCNSGR